MLSRQRSLCGIAAPLILASLCTACTEPASESVPIPTLQTLSLAAEIAQEGAVRIPPETLAFDWMQTVWAYGIFRLHQASQAEQWRQYNRDWLHHSLDDFTGDDPHRFHSSDSMSPALIAASLMATDPTQDFSPITEAADRYLSAAARTEEGAIVHWDVENPWGFSSEQIWIDSMFMFGLFMLQQYQHSGEHTYLEQFEAQYVLFSHLCRSAEDLYYHAYDDANDINIPEEPVFWARGNAWVLIAAAEALHIIPPNDPIHQTIKPMFVSHAAAIAQWQADDGLWRTVLNQPYGEDTANYTETSAAALIAYAFARGLKAGVLSEEVYLPVVHRAVEGVTARIDDNGSEWVVEGTSLGTNPGDYDYYVNIGQLDNLILGSGAVVMMLAEVDSLPQTLP